MMQLKITHCTVIYARGGDTQNLSVLRWQVIFNGRELGRKRGNMTPKARENCQLLVQRQTLRKAKHTKHH